MKTLSALSAYLTLLRKAGVVLRLSAQPPPSLTLFAPPLPLVLCPFLAVAAAARPQTLPQTWPRCRIKCYPLAHNSGCLNWVSVSSPVEEICYNACIHTCVYACIHTHTFSSTEEAKAERPGYAPRVHEKYYEQRYR